MLRVGILATMGASPPVISELVDYLERTGVNVSKLVLLSTREVLSNSWFAGAAVRSRYKDVYVDVVRLGMDDVDSEEKMYKFMEDVIDAFNRLRDYRIYLNVAGGRKEMGIILTIFGSLVGVSGIYHVITKDVKIWNVKLERLRDEIEVFGDDIPFEEKVNLYLGKRDVYDEVMFPPPSEYNVLSIPIIPYPRGVLESIKKILNVKTVSGVQAYDYDLLTKLEAANLVQVSKTKIRPTQYGVKLGHVLSKL